MKIKRKPNAVQKKGHRGFRGYPVATVAYYGPTDQIATKVAVGIVQHEGEDAEILERWFSSADLRRDPKITREIMAFIEQHGAKSTVVGPRIMGCPHEEGIDYPEGEACPECPFWAGRNRFTGEMEH